jgi:hypothetical protein
MLELLYASMFAVVILTAAIVIMVALFHVLIWVGWYKREAWDEGERAGQHNAITNPDGHYFNPYRKDK